MRIVEKERIAISPTIIIIITICLRGKQIQKRQLGKTLMRAAGNEFCPSSGNATLEKVSLNICFVLPYKNSHPCSSSKLPEEYRKVFYSCVKKFLYMQKYLFTRLPFPLFSLSCYV